jgi:hypothetical protein
MGKPHTHWRREIRADTRLESYNIQLTRKWAGQLDDTASKSAQLSEIVSDFLMWFQSISITSGLPFTVVSQLDTFVDGFLKNDDEKPLVEKTAKAITSRLARSLNVDPETRAQIAVECLRIGATVDISRVPPPFSIEDIWQSYLEHKGFQLALWESQRSGLVNVYNCYESFLMRCMATAVRQRSYSIKRQFPVDFAREFGQPICDDCWSDPQIQILRYARNAIVHEGGRETDQIKRLGHKVLVYKGYLQVYPDDLKAAFRLVEKCVDKIVAAAVQHRSFVTPYKRRK